MVTARKTAREARVDRQVQPRQPGLPCAVVYDLLRALLGEPDLVVTVVGEMRSRIFAKLSASLGAPGPHDFAVRIDAVRLSAPTRPPHPTSRFVTIAIRPSCRGGTSLRSHQFRKNGSGIFLHAYLDDPNQLESPQQIRFFAQRILNVRRPERRATRDKSCLILPVGRLTLRVFGGLSAIRWRANAEG